MAVPYTFGAATSSIPLSQLDSNFATTITLGNTAIQLGNTVTTLNNMTLVNTTISSGNVTVTNANVTSITATSDSYISGLRVGKGAGAVSTNTAVGASALAANVNGYGNAAFGYNALLSTTDGYSNTGIGRESLRSNTTGASNVGVGREALYSNTTASYNTAVGYQAGYSGTTSPNNTFIGYIAGYSTNNTTGLNTFIGFAAGDAVTTGYANTFIGGNAGDVATSGSYNVFVGYNSGGVISTGTKNTILGSYTGNQGGLDIRTASNNIVLSDGDGNWRAGYFSNGGNYSWVLSNNATPIWKNASEILQIDATATNYGIFIITGASGGTPVRLWSSTQQAGSITTTANTANYGSGSDYRLKKDVQPMSGALERVNQLRPVTWRWTSDDSYGEGFLAHELQSVVPVAVHGEKDAVHEDGTINPQQVDSSYLVGLLTAAIQELKAEFDAYKEAHP